LGIRTETLANPLEKGPLPFEQVLKIGSQVAGALDKAHRNGIAHRDLKPGNVMITRTGAKLLDLGLAKPDSVRSTRVPGVEISLSNPMECAS
jgi:serine/threonine protein kinase